MEENPSTSSGQATEVKPVERLEPAVETPKESTSASAPKKKSHKLLIIVLIILGIIVGLIILAGVAFKSAYNSLDPKLKEGVGQVYECSKKCQALPKDQQNACAEKCVNESSLKDYMSPVPSGSATNSGEVSASGVYTNTANGFSYTPPAGWTQGEQDGVIVAFTNPKAPQNSINIVSESAQGYSLSQYHDVTKKHLTQLIPGYKISNEQVTTINGVPAYMMDGAVSQEGIDVVNRLVLIVKNGKAYVITATSTPDAWSAYQSAIDASFKTFKLN